MASKRGIGRYPRGLAARTKGDRTDGEEPQAEESFFGAEAGFLVPIRFPAKKPGEPAPPPETKLPPAQFREQLEDEVREVLESLRRDRLDPEELAYFERDLRASLDELFVSNDEAPGK